MFFILEKVEILILGASASTLVELLKQDFLTLLLFLVLISIPSKSFYRESLFYRNFTEDLDF